MKKRILSLLLAALLLLSLLPAASLPARAEGEIVAEGIWCSTLEWSLDEEGWLYLFTPDCDDMPLGEWNEESGHYEMPWYPYREQIVTVQLANLDDVCEDAFYGCTHLETVLFYGDPDTIHPTAFADCPIQDLYCSFSLEALYWILDKSGIEEFGAERMHYLGWNSISDHWTECDTEPTCTTDGVVGLSCPCGYVLGEVTPALGHDFVDGVCTRCGADSDWIGGSCGTEGDNLRWNLNLANGYLLICNFGDSDNSEMALGDWNEETQQYEMPWYPYREQIGFVILYNPVNVTANAFTGCVNLTGLYIGCSLEYMDPCAFAGCQLQDAYYESSRFSWESILENSGLEAFEAERIHCEVSFPDEDINTTHWTYCDTAPTCFNNGVNGWTCPCGYERGEITPALGHAYENGVCTRCGTRKGESAGTCGAQRDNLIWRLDPNTGVMRITGVGEMKDATDSNGSYDYLVTYGSTNMHLMPWAQYREQILALVVEDGVSSIGSHAFSDCCYLTSAELPGSLRTIGDSAFSGCYSLSSAVIPEGVETIWDRAFEFCSGLSSVSMPASLRSLGSFAFSWCPDLTTVTLAEGITELPACLFQESGLTSFSIPASVTEIDDMAFIYCYELASFSVHPDNPVYWVGEDGILYANQDEEEILFRCPPALEDLGDYTVSSSVDRLEWGAFEDCRNLSAVTIPENITELPPFVFSNSGLRTLALPASISKLGGWAFQGCQLEDLYFGGTADAWAALDPAYAVFSAQRVHFGVTDPESHWSGEITKAPGCATLGYRDESCPCGYARRAELPALGHDFVEGVCTRCGQIDYEADGAELPFGDVPETAYYAEAVSWALNNGIAAGTSEDSFSPDEACSRAQLMTFLWRAAGCPEPNSQDCPFTDVPADAYYTKAVLWAVEQGITSGTSATTFSPKQVCTRAQTVTFLWRSIGKPSRTSSNPFTDLVFNSYYYKAVRWAIAVHIVSGVSETSFAPNQACTRGQAVTILYRYYHLE